MKLAIIGAGVLSNFIIDIIEPMSDVEVVGMYDNRYPNLECDHNIPVLGGVDDMPANKDIQYVIAIGDPAIRRNIYSNGRERGMEFPAIIHPSAVIASRTHVEDGVIVGPFCTVLSGSKVGKASCLLSGVNINQNISIGAYSLIGAGACIGNGASLGIGSHISMGSVIGPEEIVDDWQYVSQ